MMMTPGSGSCGIVPGPLPKAIKGSDILTGIQVGSRVYCPSESVPHARENDMGEAQRAWGGWRGVANSWGHRTTVQYGFHSHSR
jgi:hypothetical protein